MVEISSKDASKIKPLFSCFNETMVLSFLQGHMGRGWTDNLSDPTYAQIIVGSFCFLAGDADSPDADSLVRNIPADYPSHCLLFVPENDAWANRIEAAYPGRYEKIMRIAIKKEKDCFDTIKLQSFIDRLPPDFCIVPIDETIYQESLRHEFSLDWCSQFHSAQDYLHRGIGFCVLHNGGIVCGASSYTIYDEGIEIEIDTHPDYQKRGLASACAAKLILECIRQGRYPSWDAHDQVSAALAEKLGYHRDNEYVTYVIKELT